MVFVPSLEKWFSVPKMFVLLLETKKICFFSVQVIFHCCGWTESPQLRSERSHFYRNVADDDDNVTDDDVTDDDDANGDNVKPDHH